jgi:demethylmenaquinone methyltransferase/2-methoxy-6-polyprenyl-1,4-benzoquinol methylase
MENLTDFGFRRMAPGEKTHAVREVFDSVAENYDLMNDVMSGGLHRLWKKAFVTWLRPRPDMRLLDLAGGTGDIAFRYLAAGGGDVVVCDINAEMLAVGRQRAVRRKLSDGLVWACGSGEDLPLPSGSVDAVSCAFGIRNFTDIAAALVEIRRVLKPGGRFLCLEFSRLALPGLEGLYDAYSFKLVPRMGRLIAGDEDSYRYLVESIRKFPDQESFTGMLTDAGFGNVTHRNLTGGVAAMHSAWRI